MKNAIKKIFVCLSIALSMLLSSCGTAEKINPTLLAELHNQSGKDICRIILDCGRYSFTIETFECTTDYGFNYFGRDLYNGRYVKEIKDERTNSLMSEFPTDSTRFTEWGDCVYSSLYASGYHEHVYNNGDEVSFIASYNIYDVYMDEDSLYIMKRQFEYDEIFDDKPRQESPVFLFSGSLEDLNSGQLMEEWRIKQREKAKQAYEQEQATWKAEEARRKKEEMTINGQQIHEGEKIVKIEWNEEIKTSYTRDDEDDFRFSSLSKRVPKGKIWILIYIDEDYTFENGAVWAFVPDVFVDGEKLNWYRDREFSDKSTIHLAKARDQNMRFYSGSSIQGVSSRTQNENYGQSKLVSYKGYLWFLEVPE